MFKYGYSYDSQTSDSSEESTWLSLRVVLDTVRGLCTRVNMTLRYLSVCIYISIYMHMTIYEFEWFALPHAKRPYQICGWMSAKYNVRKHSLGNKCLACLNGKNGSWNLTIHKINLCLPLKVLIKIYTKEFSTFFNLHQLQFCLIAHLLFSN